MENSALKAVAFDMDGLMFDTEKIYWNAACELLAKRGAVYTQELCDEIMGRPPRVCFERFIEKFSLTDTWEELQNESENIFIRRLPKEYAPMPGLFDLLDTLEQHKIPKAICTSSSRRIMTAVLDQEHLLPRFDFTITGNDIINGKPHPEVYQKAAQQFGIRPEEMLVLEDSEAGCLAACHAGAVCFVILAEHNRNFKFEHAAKILSSLKSPEIIQVLR